MYGTRTMRVYQHILGVKGAGMLGHWGGVILATCTTQGIRVEGAISTQPYPSVCWMVQRLTSRRLDSFRWLTPIDRSTRT